MLAEQLLPEVNQSLLMLGVEENFSLCCTRTVFSEKRSTTNKECVLLQLLIANQSAFFFQAYGYFSEYHNDTGLGGTACAWRVKNDFLCSTGWRLCESLIPEVHIQFVYQVYSHTHLFAAAQPVLTARAAVQKPDLDYHAHLFQC